MKINEEVCRCGPTWIQLHAPEYSVAFVSGSSRSLASHSGLPVRQSSMMAQLGWRHSSPPTTSLHLAMKMKAQPTQWHARYMAALSLMKRRKGVLIHENA